MYALVDCNNFYVSCERVFDPTLMGKPVIILSNNDGCAISRSDEAKAIGIEMGAVPHMIADKIKMHDVKMLSSNYTLYGDMSDRVMSILSEFAPQMEIYSIDECFLNLSGMLSTDLQKLGVKIRNTVVSRTGLPVCVGIAPTKALAKMANRYAKKNRRSIGVHWAANEMLIKQMLAETEIGAVWGIGRQHALMLSKSGIKTAAEFSALPADFVRTKMSVVGERLQNELKGIKCIAFEECIPAKKTISHGRSFGSLITDKVKISEALGNYAAHCALKLREQKSITSEVKVYLNTNPHRPQDRQYYRSVIVQVATATSSTPEIIKYALQGLEIIFREGYNFLKCGVELRNLLPENEVPLNIFATADNKKEKQISAAIDSVNLALGKEIVRFGIQGFKRPYRARAAYLSKKYTTDLNDIIKIKN